MKPRVLLPKAWSSNSLLNLGKAQVWCEFVLTHCGKAFCSRSSLRSSRKSFILSGKSMQACASAFLCWTASNVGAADGAIVFVDRRVGGAVVGRVVVGGVLGIPVVFSVVFSVMFRNKAAPTPRCTDSCSFVALVSFTAVPVSVSILPAVLPSDFLMLTLGQARTSMDFTA